MRRFSFLAVLAAMLVGCEEEPPPPPEPVRQEPPKKTADQMYNETMQQLNPFLLPNPPNGPELATVIRTSVGKFRPPAEPNGPEAMSRVEGDLNRMISEARESKRWRQVVALCDGLDVFAQGPPPKTGDLNTIARYREQAMAELSKPQVKVTGFVNEYVMLEVTLPDMTGGPAEVESVSVREGDDFLADPADPSKPLLRLDDIIGDNLGIRVYYYKTDNSWTVDGPRA